MATQPPPMCVVCFSEESERRSSFLGRFSRQKYNATDFMCTFHGKLHNRCDPSSSRDRSRSPLRLEPLSEAARVALDVVCKRDADRRVDDQRAIIARQEKELIAKNEQIRCLKSGVGVEMGNVWIEHGRIFPEMRPNKERRESEMSLHDFLKKARGDMERLQVNLLEAGMNFPCDGEATDEEDEEEAEEDEEEEGIE